MRWCARDECAGDRERGVGGVNVGARDDDDGCDGWCAARERRKEGAVADDDAREWDERDDDDGADDGYDGV